MILLNFCGFYGDNRVVTVIWFIRFIDGVAMSGTWRWDKVDNQPCFR